MTSGPSTEGPIMSVALDRALAPRARDWNAMWVFLLTTPSVECRFQFYVGLVGRDLFTILPIVQNFLLHAKSVDVVVSFASAGLSLYIPLSLSRKPSHPNSNLPHRIESGSHESIERSNGGGKATAG